MARRRSDAKDIAIGWAKFSDLRALPSSRDAFKAAYSREYPSEKAGAIPVKAGVLFRFAHEIRVGDIVVYPSKRDRMVNIGLVASDYIFSPKPDPAYPHRPAGRLEGSQATGGVHAVRAL